MDLELIAEYLAEEAGHPGRTISWELGIDDFLYLTPDMAFIFHEGRRLVHLAASKADRERVLLPAKRDPPNSDACISYACLLQSQLEDSDCMRDFAFLSGRAAVIGTMKAEEVPVASAYELDWEDVDIVRTLVSFLRGDWRVPPGTGRQPESVSQAQERWLESLGWSRPHAVSGRVYTMATLAKEVELYERDGYVYPPNQVVKAIMASLHRQAKSSLPRESHSVVQKSHSRPSSQCG